MTIHDDVWSAESRAWGLDRLAWDDDEDGLPVDPDESPETLGDRSD